MLGHLKTRPPGKTASYDIILVTTLFISMYFVETFQRPHADYLLVQGYSC